MASQINRRRLSAGRLEQRVMPFPSEHEMYLDMERDNTEEARGYMREAVSALQEIYTIRGEDTDVAAICDRILSQSWACSA